MHKCLILFVFLLGNIAFAQTATPRLPVDVNTTKITSLGSGGTTIHNRIPVIKVGQKWTPEELSNVLEQHLKINPNTSLTITKIEKNTRGSRAVLGVNYDNMPVLERDVVAILDSFGHVTSVTVNLPMSNSRPVSSSINDRQVLEIVQNQLRTSAFTGTLSLSNTVTRGWIARGNKLYPVADVALLDPVRAKHFQVRIDLNAERTIGLIERTIH
jgi:hypothetical protein